MSYANSTPSKKRFLVTGRNEVVSKVIFLHLSVILFTGGGASVHAGMPPPRTTYPPDYVPPRDYVPPQTTYPPGLRTTPRDYVPPGTTYPPGLRTPPPPAADSSIRSTSGRYASYWNAFLFSDRFEIVSKGKLGEFCSKWTHQERLFIMNTFVIFIATGSHPGK